MSDLLPIMQYREEIITAVRENNVVVIRAETGAGKSTQVPQFLLECSPKVVVTQPRRLAAIGIAQRVAEEMESELGSLVGYRIALDRKDSEDTRLLFCTDGLELVCEITTNDLPEGILVIDELHEWNQNIETLVAWTRYQLQRGVPYKVVLMSATIDPTSIADYFGRVAIIEVPGRTFPVTEMRTGKNLVDSVAKLIDQGFNVLVFQPGKAEIFKTISELKGKGLQAEILPLHADMTYDEQALCFQSYDRPKCIVATNVAQTSITIPDIDAVVDSGLERRVEYVDGVEGLYLRPISKADREQRKGRAGRTKAGIYIDFCPTSLPDRPAYPQPDIIRLPVEKQLLQLARIGVELDELKFFHQPPDEHIQTARRTLFCLGCVDRWGSLTRLGDRVAQLPVSPRWARMMVEAEDRKVLPDVITLVSIMEQGRITNGKSDAWKGVANISTWSDAFVQLAAYEAAVNIPASQLEAQGIDPRALAESRDMRQRLLMNSHIPRPRGKKRKISRGRENDIICSLYAGIADCLYKRSVVRGYKDKNANTRGLPSGSVVADADWVIGLPWNLQLQTDFGPRTLRLITMATRVDTDMLREVAPHLVVEEEKESGDTAHNRARTIRISFNGMLLTEEQKRIN